MTSPAAEILAALEVMESPLPILLLNHRRKQKYHTVLLCGPTRVVKDYTPHRRFAYDPEGKFSLDDHDDNWCLEFLRFTATQIREIAFILKIPSRFRFGYRASPGDALALVLYRLSAPTRLKDAVNIFNR